VLDPAKVDEAARTLLGGMPPADLSDELRRVLYDFHPVADLPPWATIGDRTCLSRSFVSVFETGDHGIQVVSLRRVAAGLGLRFAALVDDPADQAAPLSVPTTTGDGR
jgi:hypothetical protein